MPSTVALTGASGFIGQAIANQLSQAGVKVRGLVRTHPKIPGLEHPNITLINGSLNNLESLHTLIQGCDSLINCAGSIRGRRREDFIATNVQGVTNLLKVCLSQSFPPQIIQISSLAIGSRLKKRKRRIRHNVRSALPRPNILAISGFFIGSTDRVLAVGRPPPLSSSKRKN